MKLLKREEGSEELESSRWRAYASSPLSQFKKGELRKDETEVEDRSLLQSREPAVHRYAATESALRRSHRFGRRSKSRSWDLFSFTI